MICGTALARMMGETRRRHRIRTVSRRYFTNTAELNLAQAQLSERLALVQLYNAPGGRMAVSRMLLRACVCLFAGLAGCASVGPRSLKADQVEYARALGEAKKREILALLRYADLRDF
jgi:hypothetical protein